MTLFFRSLDFSQIQTVCAEQVSDTISKIVRTLIIIGFHLFAAYFFYMLFNIHALSRDKVLFFTVKGGSLKSAEN
jgi:hypothetical protein